MQTIVSARHTHLTDTLKSYAQQKIGAAVERVFDQPAAKIDVELSFLGQTIKGANQECRVTVFIPKGKTVVIYETDDDMYKAIDMAHHRLVLQVNREGGRKKNTTVTRKLAARERHLIAQQNLTAQPEVWEREVQEFEASRASL